MKILLQGSLLKIEHFERHFVASLFAVIGTASLLHFLAFGHSLTIAKSGPEQTPSPNYLKYLAVSSECMGAGPLRDVPLFVGVLLIVVPDAGPDGEQQQLMRTLCTYINTANRMITREELKQRNGLDGLRRRGMDMHHRL